MSTVSHHGAGQHGTGDHGPGHHGTGHHGPGHHGPLAELRDWPGWPLVSLHSPGHPMRAETFVRDGEYVLRAEIPGVDARKDIEVTACRGTLTIRARRRPDTPGRHHSEFRYGTFTRSFRLPASADESRIRALYGSGILEVTVGLTAEAAEQARRRVHVHVNHYIDPT